MISIQHFASQHSYLCYNVRISASVDQQATNFNVPPFGSPHNGRASILMDASTDTRERIQERES